MKREKLAAGIVRVSDDLVFLCELMGTMVFNAPMSADQTFLANQAALYLKPLDSASRIERLKNDLGKLKTFFSSGSMAERLAWWYDGTGPKPAPTGGFLHRQRLRVGFAYSEINATPKIQAHADVLVPNPLVMQNKAYLLSSGTFAGVMLHEVTHFVLGTRDVKYDQLRRGHGNLERLDATDRYKNADNWRIFYQNMSANRRRETHQIDEGWNCSVHWVGKA
jgi:hypothetical protein